MDRRRFVGISAAALLALSELRTARAACGPGLPDCPQGQICVEQGGDTICVIPVTPIAPCPPGQVCNGLNSPAATSTSTSADGERRKARKRRKRRR